MKHEFFFNEIIVDTLIKIWKKHLLEYGLEACSVHYQLLTYLDKIVIKYIGLFFPI